MLFCEVAVLHTSHLLYFLLFGKYFWPLLGVVVIVILLLLYFLTQCVDDYFKTSASLFSLFFSQNRNIIDLIQELSMYYCSLLLFSCITVLLYYVTSLLL